MKKPQKAMVLEYLQTGNTLSQPEAAKYFNCWRLSAIIFTLRVKEHHPIDTILSKTKSHYAQYKLRK